MRVGILGPLEVRDTAGQPVQVGGTRLRALLIRLALDAGHPVSAERLAGDLWPEAGPADAANALQALVSRLRGAMGRDLVERGPGGYRLAVDPAEVDAAAFERQVSAARAVLAAGEQARGAALLRAALELWRGPALADVQGTPYAVGPAARLEEIRLAATEDRMEADLALGDGARIVPEAEELAGAHPFRERLRGLLMKALYQAGRQADALAVYTDTRELLASRLGVDPSPALSAVQLAILRAEPSAGAGPPAAGAPAADMAVRGVPGAAAPDGADQPAPSAAAGAAVQAGPAAPTQPPAPATGRNERAGRPRSSNLPAQLTSFIGREDELGRVAKLLEETRLVTLTGPGGTGKTRLAIEAAAQLAGQLPDGAWFIPLAPVRDALDVPQAVLAAIGMDEASWLADAESSRIVVIQPLDRLADALASRQLVLVLDNCEHLLDSVAWLAGRVLAAAPGVRILSTSREPLGITGETLCPVPSLPLPPVGAEPAEAMEFGAVRLLADRAAAVRPGFAIDHGNVQPVVQICRALDGSPLAIELAAARLRSLTPTQVAGRLGDRFSLLTAGNRTALPRHQTLRAVVDWSWELLDADEQAVLRRLAVFSGGATPDSAEQVCALGGDPARIVDVIASLVDKSLVLATGELDVRYRLLETVRVYATERLTEAGEEDQARAAHAGYFVKMAERAEPELRTHAQLHWLNRLSAEHDNCSAALRYAIDSCDAVLALRFVGALAWFWIMRDYDAEAGEWAAAVIGITEGIPPGLEEAYAFCGFVAAVSAASTADDANTTQLREAMLQLVSLVPGEPRHPVLALAKPLIGLLTGDRQAALAGLRALVAHPDPWVQAAQHAIRGHLAINDGDVAEAAAALAQSLTGYQAVGDRLGIVVSLGGLAGVASAQGEPAEAVRLLEEARTFAAQGLHGNWADMMLMPLGKARAEAGDVDTARAELQRGVRIAERIGEYDDQVAGYVGLSEIARRDGDLAQARQLLERAVQIAEPRLRRPGMAGASAKAFSKLGCVAEQDGDLAAAAHWHAKAMETACHAEAAFLLGNSSLAEVVEGFAALAAARREHAPAAELLGLAHTLHGFRDAASLEVTRTTATVTGEIGDAAFTAAYARGQLLTRDDAVRLVP